MKENKSKKLILNIGSACFYLVLWHIISVAVGKELLIPTPARVFETLISLASAKTFYIDTGLSVIRIAAGFAFAVLFGIIAAILTSCSKALKTLFYPLVSTVRATPVASFIILTLLWIKTTYVPVFIAFLMVMPVVWSNISQGIETADKKLLQAADIFNLSLSKKIKYIYIPNCVPFFKNSAASGIGLAWKAGIAAEVICSPSFAIGSRLYDSKIYLETPELFAWTGTVVILSILIEKLTVSILNKVFKDY